MDVKYNIYISTSANGPWALINEDPIADNQSLNRYVISGLVEDQIYYLKIVGGYEEHGNFIPLIRQPISNRKAGLVSIADAAIAPLKVKHRSPVPPVPPVQETQTIEAGVYWYIEDIA